MSTNPPPWNEPAFPVVLALGQQYAQSEGMTLRDYFAAAALPMVQKSCEGASMEDMQEDCRRADVPGNAYALMAVRAYEIADEMLRRRTVGP